MSSVFILRHEDGQFASNLHIFSNVDSALDHMKVLVSNDDDLMHYQLMKYSLDEESQQYLFDHEYDLEELVDVREYEESDGLSYLDSEEEPEVDSP